MEMYTTLMTVFFLSMVLCGCSLESFFDDWLACWVAVVTLIVAIACVVALNTKE